MRKWGRICDDIGLDSVNISGLKPAGDRFRLNLRVQSSYPRPGGEEHSCSPPQMGLYGKRVAFVFAAENRVDNLYVCIAF